MDPKTGDNPIIDAFDAIVSAKNSGRLGQPGDLDDAHWQVDMGESGEVSGCA